MPESLVVKKGVEDVGQDSGAMPGPVSDTAQATKGPVIQQAWYMVPGSAVLPRPWPGSVEEQVEETC